MYRFMAQIFKRSGGKTWRVRLVKAGYPMAHVSFKTFAEARLFAITHAGEYAADPLKFLEWLKIFRKKQKTLRVKQGLKNRR